MPGAGWLRVRPRPWPGLGDWLSCPRQCAHITGSLALRPHPEELPHPEPVQVRGESRLSAPYLAAGGQRGRGMVLLAG